MNKHTTLHSQVRLMGRILGALALLWATVACSVQGEITDLTERTRIPVLGQAVGLVSGAQQNIDVNGYKISASVGDYSGGIEHTVNGYKVFTSVQGNIAAETVMDVVE